MSPPPSDLDAAILGNLLAQTTRAYEEQVQALSQEKELAQVTLASIGDGVITTDEQGLVSYLNPVAETLTGLAMSAARGRPLEEVFRLVEESTGEEAAVRIGPALAGEGRTVGEGRRLLMRSDGQRFAVEHTATAIRDSEQRAIGVVIVFQDVTDQRLLALQLTHQASHDALTGLLNRQAFDGHLQDLLRETQSSGEHHCLFYMDLDQFKVVNDTCGHLAGDELLRRIAARILDEVRGGDLVARLGGDEFGVLLPHCDLEPGLRTAHRIHRSLTGYRFAWQDKAFAVGVSVGVVPIDRRSENLAQVLSAADHACYVAKERGRNRVQVYQRDDAEVVRRTDEMNWVVRIQQTLEEGRFLLYGQRIERVGQPDGEGGGLFFEVLLRMMDEAGKVLTSTSFVRAAERYGLMRRIDRWVLARVLDELDDWSRDDLDRLETCSINLSAVSVSDETFLDFARGELASHDIPAEKLCFEITETAAMASQAQAERLIHELRGLGCCFALDDFGSGMASYGKLKGLAVRFLKIDGLFIRDLDSNPLDRAMVESINQMAHVLGVETIAEGVASGRLLGHLRELGVDYAQGFHLHRPGPLDDLRGALPMPRSALGG